MTRSESSLVRARGLRRERTLACSRFVDGRFRNTRPEARPRLQGSPLPLLGEYFFGGAERVPRTPLPVVDPLPEWARPNEAGLRVTWLGHSTVLLEMDGAVVLTDPVFGSRVSPVSFAGPKRFHPTPVDVGALPPLDAVILSHDHYDHLCVSTMNALAKVGTPIVTSLGVGARLEALGVPHDRIVELDWWETHDLGRVRVTAAPSQHFSGRALLDRNRTSWSSMVIESERHRVFFSGDTGLTGEYREIGSRLGPFDVVMLEVGAFHPAWSDVHLGPENALLAHAMLGSGALLPVHWGTFNLALHAWDEPAETLYEVGRARGVRLLTPKVGDPIVPSRVEALAPWWRAHS